MPRSMWSGSISFGLVNVPVRLVSAVRDRGVHLHLLSREGHCRLRRKLVCPENDEEVDYKDTVRGYEISPDQYVILDPREIQDLRPQSSRAIEIARFVKIEQIDPLYYERPYYLLPDEGGEQAYRLLVEAMSKAGRVALARFVMREKQYLAALRPVGGVLCLETMNYADEVVPLAEVATPHAQKIDVKQLAVAQQLIEALAGDFDPEQFHDEYRQRLQELIQRKAEGEEVEVHAPAEERPGRTINLMDALQKSLNQIQKPQKKPGKPAAQRPRRKSA